MNPRSNDTQHEPVPADASSIAAYFALACGLTWTFTTPLALAWLQHRVPPGYAIGLAGLSAFGPLIAGVLVASRQKRVREMFTHWRTHPIWILAALAMPSVMHMAATALYVTTGGTAPGWFHPPSVPEQYAALVVFSIGEEFGWRGFAHPRMVSRFGFVKGSLLLGLGWGIWHLFFSVTPHGSIDPFIFAIMLLELPLYSVLIAWLFERSGRSMAVAIAVHAGAHLDHFENATRDVRLHGIHIALVAVLAVIAGRSLMRRELPAPAGPVAEPKAIARG